MFFQIFNEQIPMEVLEECRFSGQIGFIQEWNLVGLGSFKDL